MANTWLNSDGLYIKFGRTEGAVVKSGAYNIDGPYNVVELTLDYSDLAATSSILSDNIIIPAGARIVKCEIETVTAFASAASAFVLNLGLVRQDRSTSYDSDGFVAVIPQSAMDAAGEIANVDVSHTYKGTLVGTTLAYSGLIVGDYDTAAPTAGQAKVRIFYWMAS